jgi:RNA polymerase sigma factor (sigma-70 family)
MNIQPELIEACRKKERKAEYELYKITFSYLMSICIRYTRQQEKAREVLNIGFYRILKSLDKYNSEAPIKPWIRKIMINTLINEHKKEKIHYGNIEYVDNYSDGEYSELSGALEKTNADQIYKFIAMLPPASQQVFNLYFVDGYKHREIADMLSISEGTSKWHLNSAKSKLREMLETVNIEKTILNEQ